LLSFSLLIKNIIERENLPLAKKEILKEMVLIRRNFFQEE